MAHFLYPLLILIGLWNIFSFIVVWIDKNRSRTQRERVPEVVLFFSAACLGAAGVFTGMLVFRHKTLKFHFIFGIGLLLIEQALLAWLLVDKFIKN